MGGGLFGCEWVGGWREEGVFFFLGVEEGGLGGKGERGLEEEGREEEGVLFLGGRTGSFVERGGGVRRGREGRGLCF